MKNAEEKLRAETKKIVDGNAGIEVIYEAKLGIPYEEITAAAARIDASLIVLGTHGRTGFDHILFGSTAERVVRSATCPVLTVRLQAD